MFDDGQGGATSTSNTSTATSSTRAATNSAAVTNASTATGMCNAPGDAIQVCIPSMGLCAPATSPIHEELAQVLEQIPCEEPEFCSCDWTVNQIYCQTPGAGCCYAVSASLERFCEGLPFVVGGTSRVAPLTEGAGWLSDEALGHASFALDLRGLSLADRAAIGGAYREDALAEHASVASFARLILSLLAFGAPADLVASAQRALGDEVRHASLCFGLARAFDDRVLGPGALDVRGALEDRLDVARFVTAVVREGCIEETIAALSVARARDAATEPTVALALASIARDEAEHAALSYRVLAFMLARHGEIAHRAARRAFEEGLAAHALASAAATSIDAGDLARRACHGRLSDRERRKVAQDAIREVVRPTAEALLAAFRDASGARDDGRTSDRDAPRSS